MLPGYSCTVCVISLHSCLGSFANGQYVRDSRNPKHGGLPCLSHGRHAMQVPNRVAVAQMTATGDHDANLATCRRLAERAAAERCSMLFLPECCAFIGLNSAEVTGRLLAAVRSAAMR